jgi:hypothetical protein
MFVRTKTIIETQEMQIQNLKVEITSLRDILRLKNDLTVKQQNEIFDLTQKVRVLSNRLEDMTLRNKEGMASYG